MVSNRAAFDELDLSGRPAHLVTLARTLVDELDRQAADGKGVSAALVREYLDLLGELVAEEPGREKATVLAAVRDSSKARKAKSSRAG